MTSPNAHRPPEGRRFWKIAAITLGAGTLIVGTVAVVGAWLFINRGLTPLLERRLSILLERELELGELEALSWNGLRVGPSKLNPTDTDPSYATAESVDVRLNPLQVLFERELDIDLRLVGAAGYVEQHPEDGWLGLDVPTFEPPPEEPLVKVRMDDIEVVDSQITLVPLPADGAAPTPLLMEDLNGAVGIDPVEVNGQDSQRVEFNAIATPPKGGQLDITGAVVPVASGNSEQPIQQEITLGVSGEGVAAETAMAFILPTLGQQNLPLEATAGRVSGNWTISFLPAQPITVEGAGSVDNGQLQIASLPSTGPWGNTIDDIDAKARFKGTTITIDSAKGSYSDLMATATGTVDWNEGYDLIAQVTDVDLQQLLEKSEVDSPIDLSGVFDSNIAITGPILQPKFSANVIATEPVIVDRIVLNGVNADVVMENERLENLLDTVTVTQVSANPELGGQVSGSGVLNLAQLAEGGPPELNFQAEATNVSGDEIAALYDVEQLPVTLGIVDATATVIGPPNTLETRINLQAPNLAYGGQVYPATATAVFADGGLLIPQAQVSVGSGTLTGDGKVERDSWQANILADNIDFQTLGLTQVPPATLNADVALAGPVQEASLENLLAMGDYSLQLADGSIQGDAELINGSWRTDADLNALGLSQFAAQLRGNASGRVSLTGQIDALTLADLRGQGDLVFSAGLAGFSPQLAGFDAPLKSRFAWTGQELLIEDASSAQLQARGVVSPQLVGNKFEGIRGFSLDLDAQRYPLALLPSPVPVDGFASFNGRLMGTPGNPQMNGTLLLEQFGVNQVAFDPVLLGPVSYQSQTGLNVDLDGQNGPTASGLADGIAINFQTPRNFNFDVSWQGAQASGRTDGDVLRATLQDLPLQALGLPVVDRLGGGLKGTLSSQGEWVVDLNRQTLVGNVFIAQPGLGYINAQQLTGQLAYRDRRVFVEQGELIFNTCSQRLMTDSPLPTYCAAGDVADSIYRFNGNLQLDTLAYNAKVVVENGDVRDVLTALAIKDFEDLIQTFQVPTWLENPPPSEEIPGILATQAAGNSQAALLDQVRRLAEIQEIQTQVALAEAKNPIPPLDVLEGRFDATVSVSGNPEQLPEIMFDVAGYDWMWGREFVADRVIALGQLANGNLTLQPVRLETALSPDAEGNPQLAFVNLAGNLSLVEQDSSGLQLDVEKLPMAAVRDIFNLPLALDGRLEGLANFSGSIGNPTARGNIILADGRINNQPIAKAEGDFLYEDARLFLQGQLLQLDNNPPLNLLGNIPYGFAFMDVQPPPDAPISLSLDVADDGLALLNVLNDQVIWESGKGEVSLNVGGTLKQPTISGVMDVRDTILRSPLLPDPLTDFAGRVVFEGNQIIVQQLDGQYGNGQLQAAGAIPLGFPPIITSFELVALGTDPQTPEDVEPIIDETLPEGAGPIPGTPDSTINNIDSTPPLHPSGALTVTLDNIDLDLRGIYRGGVKGQVVVGGSLNPLLGGPQLGGVVELTNGRLFLPEGGNTSVAVEPEEIPLFVPRFENLKITLAKNIQIQQSNLLNVVAQGDLRISGPLRPFRAIQPEGTIRLRSGRINLLTTTFRLAGRDNVAQFFPERGIADPFLDLRLRTSVAETQQSNVVEATAFAVSEVDDTSIDPFQGTAGIETIRIRATYQGSASNLLESLFISDSSDTVIELSSSPPRSRREIINLLSGSYVAALQSGQGVLNFFGGALLNSLQDFISTTLNLSEFRLFPVTSASRFASEDNSGSTLDVATEIGFDVTDNITLSLVKILTDSTPTEFNLRYRLTDEFTIRGTTNFDDRNRVLLEFETRF